ncbi:4,5-dioxygenase [Leptolyngbyaceae cyanobacterium CCMR0082]|uniref:4,5-dioxygenase n=1 Tax=Adonisia turfae CCMR0082 TaxID=2304604 RepID=A0A6M0SIQ3_9CYAN|nr:DOPA 4,5-dioxygenase family protein [Adonisia turfae]NEZ68244.1 4,5-dioxygenase [Adonisia turfae CCMR0082]
MIKRPTNIYDQYHAHVYFDGSSVAAASSLCQKAGKLFAVKVGRVHQKPIGPHPCRSCQLAFDKTQFDQLIPWLENNRGDFTVLVHGLTGNDLQDHTEHASWLGKPVPLNLLIFGD